MPTNSISLHLPPYQLFIDAIAILALPISGSELHGIMCGYLCAGAISAGEDHLRALLANKNDAAMRTTKVALFGLYAVSHQQIINFNFEFQLMLPEEDESLATRAQAFSEWCKGFTQGIEVAGIRVEQLLEEEAKEALQHLADFSQLDYDTLAIDEEDEAAFMEINEYARMAVLHIYSDLQKSAWSNNTAEKMH